VAAAVDLLALSTTRACTIGRRQYARRPLGVGAVVNAVRDGLLIRFRTASEQLAACARHRHCLHYAWRAYAADPLRSLLHSGWNDIAASAGCAGSIARARYSFFNGVAARWRARE